MNCTRSTPEKSTTWTKKEAEQRTYGEQARSIVDVSRRNFLSSAVCLQEAVSSVNTLASRPSWALVNWRRPRLTIH